MKPSYHAKQKTMDYKKIVEDTIKESSKEQQEAEIRRIKEIVQRLLEKIDTLKKKRIELDKEIKVQEDDLDNLKTGRLDKIEERREKDPEYRKYTTVTVRRVEKDYLPFQPWRSPWIVSFGDYIPAFDSTFATTAGTVWTGNNCSTFTGIDFQNFTGGTYTINGRIINL